MKVQPGKNMYAVGGATLVSSLINLNLIDELRLVVNPIILGEGKALCKSN
jgi:dihydrofolate reductase